MAGSASPATRSVTHRGDSPANLPTVCACQPLHTLLHHQSQCESLTRNRPAHYADKGLARRRSIRHVLPGQLKVARLTIIHLYVQRSRPVEPARWLTTSCIAVRIYTVYSSRVSSLSMLYLWPRPMMIRPGVRARSKGPTGFQYPSYTNQRAPKSSAIRLGDILSDNPYPRGPGCESDCLSTLSPTRFLAIVLDYVKIGLSSRPVGPRRPEETSPPHHGSPSHSSLITIAEKTRTPGDIKKPSTRQTPGLICPINQPTISSIR